MADGNFDYINTIKLLLGKRQIEDEILQIYVDLTKQSILNYCNLNELPSALNFTLCTICAETIVEQLLNSSKSEIVGNISSVSEDGRTVSFTNGSEFKVAVENKITHLAELNRYKKLYRL